jgi:hypothetical protein
MPTVRPLKLSILSEMAERAAALGTDPPRLALVGALERGIAFLEEAGPSSDPWREKVARRAHYDILRYRALELAEVNQELDRSVDELASESRALHDQLWESHECAGRLKVELGRRAVPKTRPEPAPMIGSGGPGKVRRSTAERLLEGLGRLELELEVPDHLAARLESFDGWRQAGEAEWGAALPLVALAHGLAALELERQRGTAAGCDAVPQPRALEALRYRISELSEANRILEIRQTAFRIDNRGMGIRLEQLRGEIADLEQTVHAIHARQSRPTPRAGLLRRLAGWRKRSGK